METVDFQIRERIPVIAETDVLVVGGGAGGLGAAVMSARCGAKNGACGTAWFFGRNDFIRGNFSDDAERLFAGWHPAACGAA